MKTEQLFDDLTFKDDLVPAIIQEVSGEVLTLCYMTREAIEKTLETGIVHLFRRSKGRLMIKGETSGHTQHVKELRVDCAGNSLLLVVEQKVAGCHKGYMSCYYRRYDPETGDYEVTAEKVFDPEDVYGG
jgi:phosphoribosyl-AMP cyclohydrolase